MSGSPRASRARVGASTVALVILAAAVAPRWTALAQTPAFEVASVKSVASGRDEPSIAATPGGRFTATNVTLERLVRWAYQAQSIRISGQPEWFGRDRFDVIAKAEDDASTDRLARMVQALLADRFNLEVHREAKEMAVYALVAGKGGFKPAKSEYRGDGPVRLMRKGSAVELSAPAGATLGQFAAFLSGQVGRPVLDRSGIVGVFDIRLEFVPEPPSSLAEAAADPGGGPSIFTAVQEQTGLKLEPSRGTVEILVVDHAEKPHAN